MEQCEASTTEGTSGLPCGPPQEANALNGTPTLPSGYCGTEGSAAAGIYGF